MPATPGLFEDQTVRVWRRDGRKPEKDPQRGKPEHRRTKWTVAKARERFSELLRKTEAEPQPIYNRDRLVAVVINAESFEEYSAWSERTRQRSIADAFDELRRILGEEEYELEIPPREDRRNEITEVLDELRC